MFSRRRREVVEHELQHVAAAASNLPVIQDRPGSSSDANLADEVGFESQLEQADGGVVAWRNLVAAFMFEALLWGWSSSPLFSSNIVQPPMITPTDSTPSFHQAFPSPSASSKTITRSCPNSKVTPTSLSSGPWHQGYPISEPPSWPLS